MDVDQLIGIPDSQIAKEARDLAREVSEPYLSTTLCVPGYLVPSWQRRLRFPPILSYWR
jgi:hypothetical protein